MLDVAAPLQSDREAWLAQRLGHVTASRVADVVARIKTGYAASRANYAGQLIAERLTGTNGATFTNEAMRWGTDNEPYARAAYEFRTDATVIDAPFIKHPAIEWSGASPDGLVGDDGLVEFKCPNTSTHIETLLGGGIPEKYRLQMQWQLACTGRAWCDFVSFDPRMPEDMRMFLRRFEREADTIAHLEREVVKFLGEIDETIDALRAVAARG